MFLFLKQIKKLSFDKNKMSIFHSELNKINKLAIKNKKNLYDKEFNDLINNNNNINIKWRIVPYIILEKKFKANKKKNVLKPYKKDDKYLNEFISKNKNHKNFIYNKSQDYNKENLYIHLKSILNHHYNKNLKENMNEKNILNFSNMAFIIILGPNKIEIISFHLFFSIWHFSSFPSLRFYKLKKK